MGKIYEKNGFWLIEGDETISNWVLQQNRLDWAWREHEIVWERIKDRPLKSCIDVGAYIGDYTKTYAKWFDKVFAFEPQKDAYDCLQRNVPESNVTSINAAVGDPSKKYEVQRCNNNPGGSVMRECENGIAFVKPDWIEDVSFIKIDAEGCEADVLATLEEIIERDHPAMQIEQNIADENEDFVYTFLEKHGYKHEILGGKKGIIYELYCE